DNDNTTALGGLISATLDLEKWDETRTYIDRLRELDYDAAAIANWEAHLCQKKGNYLEARTWARKAVDLAPDDKIYLNNLGVNAQDAGYMEEAIVALERVLQTNPDDGSAQNNLGTIYMELGDFARSRQYFEAILAHNPDDTFALSNMGVCLSRENRPQDALPFFEKLHALPHRIARAPAHYAKALLALGNFAQGWPMNEARWHAPTMTQARRLFEQPMWDGGSLKGKRLLVHSEQGYGDCLQFSRFIQRLALLPEGSRADEVLFETHPHTARLFGQSFKNVTIFDRQDTYPKAPQGVDFDVHAPMMSLPMIFGTELATVPCDIPYLQAIGRDIKKFCAELPKNNGEKRVGLVWAGAKREFSAAQIALDARRSLRLQDMATIIENHGNLQWISLQKDVPEHDKDVLTKITALHDPMPLVNDFADTAAIIANLDLIISVDTAPCHLAAAMGKPVWMLNRYDLCWRWLVGRDDTPWYPTMRLFRQTANNHWPELLRDLDAALDEYAKH
ncbi:MAG: tetratricopeptide repeat protein, partial [Pseudomonadota bacterium]